MERRWEDWLRALAGKVRHKLRTVRVVTIRSGVAAGTRISLRHASNDYQSGDAEAPVQEAIASALHHGDVFYDVGANIGFFTLVASRIVGESGRLHAFEPRGANVRALRSNLKRNGLTTARVWPVAVGAGDGETTLFCPRHPGGATIEPSESGAVDGQEHVRVVSIDHLVADGDLEPPDVVKIDVEGAELAVIEGMKSTIERYRPVIVYEVDDAVEEGVERKDARIRERLEALGYAVERIPPSYDPAQWHVIHAVGRPHDSATIPARTAERQSESRDHGND